MFNFQVALQPWNSQHLSLSELQDRLSELRLDHISELPPEIGVLELLHVALDQDWIIEEPSGRLEIRVPQEAGA